MCSLTDLAAELLAEAAASHSGRSARTIYGGHDHLLRQTVIALRAGAALDEHASPGDASLQVLVGQVKLTAGEQSWLAHPADYLIIPARRHHLDAMDDAVVLLTVVPAGLTRS